MSGEAAQSSYWAVITAPVLESRNLTDGAKLFYAEVSRRTNQRGYCWASNEALAEALGRGESTVSRYVAELEAEGFITCEFVGVRDRKRHAERHIRLAMPVPFRSDDPRNAPETSRGADADNGAGVLKNEDVKVLKSEEANPLKNEDVSVLKSEEVKVLKNEKSHKENNNSLNNNPPEPPSGGKRAPENSGTVLRQTGRKMSGLPESAKWKPERFEAFWAYYRKNVNPANRAAARKAWDKLKPDDDTIRDIGHALAGRLKTDAEWQRGIGRPHASTYLNGRMWLDEWPEEKPREQNPQREAAQEQKEAFGVWT